jgi:hypothetical protein
MSSAIIKHVTFTSSYFSYAVEQTTELLLRAQLFCSLLCLQVRDDCSNH